MIVMDHSKALIAALVAVIIVAVFASCILGTVPIPIADLVASLFGRGDTGNQVILTQIRLPRDSRIGRGRGPWCQRGGIAGSVAQSFG
jgi:iron complex transport system permease protein